MHNLTIYGAEKKNMVAFAANIFNKNIKFANKLIPAGPSVVQAGLNTSVNQSLLQTPDIAKTLKPPNKQKNARIMLFIVL